MDWGTILKWIVGIVILYFVIYLAVREAIDKSIVGQLIKTKYEVKEKEDIVTDEEIEKQLEEENNKNS